MIAGWDCLNSLIFSLTDPISLNSLSAWTNSLSILKSWSLILTDQSIQTINFVATFIFHRECNDVDPAEDLSIHLMMITDRMAKIIWISQIFSFRMHGHQTSLNS